MRPLQRHMKRSSVLSASDVRHDLLLFLCSFTVYFLYFHPVFLNLNSSLSSITADALKNYYTYVYHIRNDAGALHFTGMAYPYGEHVIYTDCQPLLSFVLRLLPFTHDHLIGIMHGLMFLSFIITPLILSRIFRLLEIGRWPSFFLSLAIAFLSPQLLKINAGHFALAYGCLIPLSILLVLKYLKNGSARTLVILTIYNCLIFLLHPYMGFCLSVFSFIALLLYELLPFRLSRVLIQLGRAFIAGLLPLLCFKLFMMLTDRHPERPTSPYGAEVMVENLDSLISPVFGPFRGIMEVFFSDRPFHFEGHTYLGFFTVLLTCLSLLCLPVFYRKVRIRKDSSVVLLASLFFLLMSFGIPMKVMNYLQIESASLNQFRAVCRFAWVFYFGFPVFLISVIYQSLAQVLRPTALQKSMTGLAIFFLAFNLLEAHYFFRLDKDAFWKDRNIFSEACLNPEEKMLLSRIKQDKPQAILPLPVFFEGSEMYSRQGSDQTMISSMMLSYHSQTPILSVLMSRSSFSETRHAIQLLNSYKADRPAAALLGREDLFVISGTSPLLPDESRLLPQVSFFAQNDSLRFGFISRNDFLSRKINLAEALVRNGAQPVRDTSGLIFLPSEARKPFLPARINDYEVIFALDSNQLATGEYALSFHYHYREVNYRMIATDLIVNRVNAQGSDWIHHFPIRHLSGFYEGYGVFETRVSLERNNKYEFMLKGSSGETYHLSDFMIRPETQDVILLRSGQDSSFNNFPK